MRYEDMIQALARRALNVLSHDECNDPYEFMPAGLEGEALQQVYQTEFICFSSLYQSGARWGY